MEADKCSDLGEGDMCLHKDNKDNPCALKNGREDSCPLGRLFQEDKAAQEEDSGER